MTATLRKIWNWYHKPGVRPVHFHLIRAALCILIACTAYACFHIGHEIAAGMFGLKSAEVLSEVVCDWFFPVHIGGAL